MAAGRRFLTRQMAGCPVHTSRSPCSIHLRQGIHVGSAGLSSGNLYLVVSDIEAARGELDGRAGRSARCFISSAPVHCAGPAPRGPAPDPKRAVLSIRLPHSAIPTATAGCSRRSRRGFPGEDSATRRRVVDRASARRGGSPWANYEPTASKNHWSEWYAAYIVARERGLTPEDAAKDAARHVEGARR